MAELTSPRLSAHLSDDTGQLVSLARPGESPVLGPAFDRYRLGDEVSDERDDEVVSATLRGDVLLLTCRNPRLGLRLHKTYEIRDDVLAKSVRYEVLGEASALLKVSSELLVDPVAYDEGYVYSPIDDGYKITTALPLVSGKDITTRQSRFIASLFAYYLPARSLVLAHYRYAIDGHHFFTDYFWQGASIGAEIFPGGAVTSLGQSFVDADTAVTLTSHYTLLDGDPRAFHRHLLSLPPFDAYRGHPTASWFTDAKMLFGDLGTGRYLIENTDAVVAEVARYLDVLDEPDPLMVFFNHWSTSGDYPYEGTLRYATYDHRRWSDPIAVTELAAAIQRLKDLSPRVKVGGYVIFFVSDAAPVFAEHPEWLSHEANGELTGGGDGVGSSALPDFATQYRDYQVEQMTQALESTGLDWLHIDFAPIEGINHGTQSVIQSWHMAEALADVGAAAGDRDKCIVENVAWMTNLWADGGYFELGQPDRWEARDWRALAAPGYLAVLGRTHRPGTWVNLVYGCSGGFGLRNAASGLRGWIRGADAMWRGVPQAMAFERVVDELLRTTASAAVTTPSWWRLETDVLEAEPMTTGDAIVVPLVRHADDAGTHTVSVDTASAGLDPAALVFGATFRLMPPTHLDAFEAPPESLTYLSLLDLCVATASGGTYEFSAELEGRRNYYHVLTQVPAWVVSSAGRRASLLLPSSHGVTIAGALGAEESDYELRIEAMLGDAEVLAHVPADWPGVRVTIDGHPARADVVDVAGGRAALVQVPSGRHAVGLASTDDATPAYRVFDEPTLPAWSIAARLLPVSGLRVDPSSADGRALLTLSALQGSEGGSVRFPYYPAQHADGVVLDVLGTGSGVTMTVDVTTGDATWRSTRVDDFTGWQPWTVDRGVLQPLDADATWAGITAVTLSAELGTTGQLAVADIRLIPSTTPPPAAAAKREVRATWTSTPPVIDGHSADEAWSSAGITGDFFVRVGGLAAEAWTSVKVCYDADALYVLYENAEPLEALGERREGLCEIWGDNHVELFVQPPSGDVYQFLVDPAGTREWHRYTEWGKDAGWQPEFAVETSLNWQASWLAEFAIPFSTLRATPEPGEIWRINFARKDLADELSNWGTGGDWLDPAGFGFVEFGPGGSTG